MYLPASRQNACHARQLRHCPQPKVLRRPGESGFSRPAVREKPRLRGLQPTHRRQIRTPYVNPSNTYWTPNRSGVTLHLSARGLPVPSKEGPKFATRASLRPLQRHDPATLTHHRSQEIPLPRRADDELPRLQAWRGATFSLHPSCCARIRPLQGSERGVRGAGTRWIVSPCIPSHGNAGRGPPRLRSDPLDHVEHEPDGRGAGGGSAAPRPLARCNMAHPRIGGESGRLGTSMFLDACADAPAVCLWPGHKTTASNVNGVDGQ